MLEAVKVQHEGVNKHLSAALQSLLERIVRKVVSSPQTVSQILEAVIDNRGLIARTVVKLVQHKYTDTTANTEEGCAQYIEAGIKLDLVAASSPCGIGKRPSVDTSNDVRTNHEAYVMAPLCSSSD